MEVDYNHKLKIAGLGVVPWTRAGLEQWFDDYRIISYYGWDAPSSSGAPPVWHPDSSLKLPAIKMSNLVKTEWYRQVITKHFSGYKLLPYRPLPPALLGAGNNYLMTDERFTTTFENKAWLRKEIGHIINFPPYKILSRSELRGMDFNNIKGDWSAIVLQHEHLSGGRGTHLVRNKTDFESAMKALPSGLIIVSLLIEGALERSVQGCITKFGVLYGAVQKQLVGNEQLTKLNVPRPDLFCGAELNTASLNAQQKIHLAEGMKVIGAKLAGAGYKGIFGVDLLIKNNDLYFLEINARLTGVTPLHTMFYGSSSQIPFYLLHTLELAGENYKLKQLPLPREQPVASMLLVHDLSESAQVLVESPRSGIYSFVGGQLNLIRPDYRFRPADAGQGLVLLQQYIPKKTIFKAGARLITIFLDSPVLDNADNLKKEIKVLITAVRAKIQTKLATAEP